MDFATDETLDFLVGLSLFLREALADYLGAVLIGDGDDFLTDGLADTLGETFFSGDLEGLFLTDLTDFLDD